MTNPIKPVVGTRYNWKGQPERLIYVGLKHYPGNGAWHQFAKVEEPDVCWCEVRESDLPSFEESTPIAPIEPSDEQLRRVWREAGGRFHGPNIETGTMPESKLLPFLRSMLDLAPAREKSEPAPVAQIETFFTIDENNFKAFEVFLSTSGRPLDLEPALTGEDNEANSISDPSLPLPRVESFAPDGAASARAVDARAILAATHRAVQGLSDADIDQMLADQATQMHISGGYVITVPMLRAILSAAQEKK